MGPDQFFLVCCKQLGKLLEEPDEANLLEMASKLRQLFLDGGSSLIHLASVNRLKLVFYVGVLPPNVPSGSIYMIGGFLDWKWHKRPRLSVAVSFDGFLDHPVATIQGATFRIKDVIKYSANNAGGTHYDEKPDPKYQCLLHASPDIKLDLALGRFRLGSQ